MLIFGVLIMLVFTIVIGKKVYDYYNSGVGKSRMVSRSKSPGVREIRYVKEVGEDNDGENDKNKEVEINKL
jgi:hypothetical protein